MDERDLSHMVLGLKFLSLYTWSVADTGSGTDWYLKSSSQYKRTAGRNLGVTRRGTKLWYHVQRYYLVVPGFCSPVARVFRWGMHKS